MNFSVFAFFDSEFSTSSSILKTVDSVNRCVTLILMGLLMLTLPLYILSPFATSCGRDSPVREEVSTEDSPLTTTPSSGTFSPALTTMTSPTATSYGETLINSPFESILA